jgi:enamine deaminase RidA (YjgF/YER057c/UK114 family)
MPVFQSINAADAPPPSGGYAQAVLLPPGRGLLFISGQIPETAAGTVPATFGEQCGLVWTHIECQLRAAGLGLDHLVKVTTYLADRTHTEENSALRNRVLGARTPALTVLITGIYDPRWLLEIEAIAITDTQT